MTPALDDLVPGKRPADARIVVALSGGVDSAVTAALLVEAGYQVVGVTLQLYDQGAAAARKGACCAGSDIRDAARVAERLGFPHYVLDYERRFRAEVIEDFAETYARGETPIPCVRCNETVKFRDLLGVARDLGADALATGHYVRRVVGADGPELHRAADPRRDQSYFLFATTAAQLAYLRFPLGGLGKDETRAQAARFELPVAAKPDSQDICFVPDGAYASLVAKLRPGALEPGDIVDLDGRVLGRHGGVINYTVGQRKGLGLSAEDKLYVVRLEPASARVVVGPRAALGESRVALHGLNWLGPRDATPGRTLRVEAKLRSAQPPAEGTLTIGEGGEAGLLLDTPATAIAPGQACVLYDASRVLGGAWIRRAAAPRAVA